MQSYESLISFNNAANTGYFYFLVICVLFAFFLIFIQTRIKFKSPTIIMPSIPLFISLIVGGFLRLFGMFDSFWYDETFTGNIARLPLKTALSVILADVHPPLAYLPYWLIGQVNSSEFVLRLPSYAAGLLIIILCYAIAKNWGNKAAEYSAFLAAIFPSLIWYSTEARAYIILTCFVLLAVYGLTYKRHIIFFVSIALLPLFHAYGYLYAFTLGLIFIQQTIKVNQLLISPIHSLRSLKNLILATIPSLLWLPFMLQQSQDVQDGFWLSAPNAGGTTYFILDMTFGGAYPALVAMFVLPILIISLTLAIWHNREDIALLFLIFFVPFLAFIMSHLWSPMYLNRALLPIGTLFIFFLSRWIIKAPRLSWFLFAAIALILAVKAHPDAQRLKTRDFVAECGNHPIYAIGLESAIIADYYSSETIYIYNNPNNLNQSLPHDIIDLFGFQWRNIAPREACIYWQDSPMTSDDQRQNLAASLAINTDYEKVILLDADTLIIEVYR